MEGFYFQKGYVMYSLKRILEIALSGKHNCMLFGSVDLMPITCEEFLFLAIHPANVVFFSGEIVHARIWTYSTHLPIFHPDN